jgi:hypothetical protein
MQCTIYIESALNNSVHLSSLSVDEATLLLSYLSSIFPFPLLSALFLSSSPCSSSSAFSSAVLFSSSSSTHQLKRLDGSFFLLLPLPLPFPLLTNSRAWMVLLFLFLFLCLYSLTDARHPRKRFGESTRRTAPCIS